MLYLLETVLHFHDSTGQTQMIPTAAKICAYLTAYKSTKQHEYTTFYYILIIM